jgi:hypothetical protein
LADDGTPNSLESKVAEIARQNSAGWYCVDLGDAWCCCIEPYGNNGDWAASATRGTRDDALRKLIEDAQAEGRA